MNNQQKKYIKKNIHIQTLDQIATTLEISKQEILEHLKKKWDRKKFQKFERNFLYQENNQRFDFASFFSKNRPSLMFLAVLIFIVYVNSLGNDFVSDDLPTILNNPSVGKIENIFATFPMGVIQGFIHFIAFHVGGLEPIFFRIFNFGLHLLSAGLIFTILRLMTKKRIALLTTTFFAVHPLLSEPVAWIAGMPYGLYAFFFLMSFFFYLLHKRNKDKKFLIFSWLGFLLSLTCSEKAIPLFLVFFLFEFFFDSLRENWKKLIPFLALSLIFSIFIIQKIDEQLIE